MIKVVKFGGSSLADAEQVKKVVKIVTSDPARKFVVVSAPGKRNKSDIKVTDMLIDLAKNALSGKDAHRAYEDIISRYGSIAHDLGMNGEIIDTISKDIRSRVDSDKSNKDKYMDNMKAAGEDNCAKLVAAYMYHEGYDAHYVNPRDVGLLLTSEYGNAQVLKISYTNLKKLNSYKGIVIFPGFFGYSEQGDVVTLPRGGSDVTGSILAAALDCDLYENFTDVDYIYTVNPNIVKDPLPIDHLTFKEMRELSYAGFSVFHEEALSPVYYKFTHVNIKNTNNPDAPGTMIHQQVNESRKHAITGISGDKGFASIYVRKYLMNREIGYGRKILQILEDENIPYEHTPSGIDDISIIVRARYLSDEIEQRIMSRIKNELSAEEISITHDQALVMIVGENCLNDSSTLCGSCEALSDAGIVVKMINQGSSKISIMIGIDEKDFESAIRVLYNKFFVV